MGFWPTWNHYNAATKKRISNICHFFLLISYNNIIHSRQDGVINREKVYSKSLLGLGDRAFKPERWHIKDVQFKLEPDSRGLLFLK